MRPTIAFVMVAALGVLAACNGNRNFTPFAQQPQTSAAAGSPLGSLLPRGMNPRAYGACTAPQYKPAAGPFIIFIANGKVKHDDFKSVSSPLTLWVSIKIKKSSKPTPAPSGSPSTAPSPTALPTDQPVYLYTGSYTLAKTKQTGCAYLFTTQSGKPLTGSKYSGEAFGSPMIKYPKYWKEKVINSGPVSIKLVKLSASGGKGTAVLKLQNGTTFDTANVNLTYRLAEP